MTTFGKTFLYNLILPCSLKDLESHNKLLTNSLYKCLTGNLEISTSLLYKHLRMNSQHGLVPFGPPANEMPFVMVSSDSHETSPSIVASLPETQ